MPAKLYGLAVSHPSHAARAMLEYKGIEYDLVNFQTGVQPIALRAVGFRGRTVPALKIDGRKVQGSKAIARTLDEVKPEPALFPADRRAAVEAAEEWGEREFQPLPRRFFRWGLSAKPELRAWVVENILKLPAPELIAPGLVPMARYFAGLSKATDGSVREGLAKLPGALDRADQLIADGTIGRAGEPNAADFQIASTIAVLRGFEDIRPALEGRPGLELADRLFPREAQTLPPFLPADALAALRA